MAGAEYHVASGDVRRTVSGQPLERAWIPADGINHQGSATIRRRGSPAPTLFSLFNFVPFALSLLNI